MPNICIDEALKQLQSHRDSVEKYIRRKQRKSLKRRRKRRKRKHTAKPIIIEYSSRLIDCLNRASFAIPNYTAEEYLRLIVPKVFCFSRNPDETIAFLRKTYGIIINLSIKHIEVDYSACEELGICALIVMDLILLECKKWRKSLKCPIEYSGKIVFGDRLSKNREINSLLCVSGILKQLGIITPAESNSQNNIVESLELLTGGDSAEVATRVIEYINRSLYRHGLRLTNLGNNYFGKLLGEIVDNCYQHGGENAVWYTIGRYNYDDASTHGKCRLVILDFGQTIYEGLKSNATKAMQKKLEHYVRKSRTWFYSQDDEETLYTLFSLQQRASRFASRKDAVRGNGTVVFLDAFQQLFSTDTFSEKSLLSITSGKCSILFDGTYRLQKVTYEGNYTNSIIAFNEENDLKKAPDHQYVRTLGNGFPGTIISIELHIDNEHISRKEQQNEI